MPENLSCFGGVREQQFLIPNLLPVRLYLGQRGRPLSSPAGSGVQGISSVLFQFSLRLVAGSGSGTGCALAEPLGMGHFSQFSAPPKWIINSRLNIGSQKTSVRSVSIITFLPKIAIRWVYGIYPFYPIFRHTQACD